VRKKHDGRQSGRIRRQPILGASANVVDRRRHHSLRHSSNSPKNARRANEQPRVQAAEVTHGPRSLYAVMAALTLCAVLASCSSSGGGVTSQNGAGVSVALYADKTGGDVGWCWSDSGPRLPDGSSCPILATRTSSILDQSWESPAHGSQMTGIAITAPNVAAVSIDGGPASADPGHPSVWLSDRASRGPRSGSRPAWGLELSRLVLVGERIGRSCQQRSLPTLRHTAGRSRPSNPDCFP
jgi:hypothetical protein